MKHVIRTLSALCILAASVNAAVPAPGLYIGQLTVKKRIFGLAVTSSVRAVAQVSEGGGLKIILLKDPNPLPNARLVIALETKIEADGSCIIPLEPQPPVTPPVSDPLPGHGVITLSLGTPEYYGGVRVSGDVFTLGYDDIPEYYINEKGQRAVINYFVAPTPNTVYKFCFRKGTPPPFRLGQF